MTRQNVCCGRKVPAPSLMALCVSALSRLLSSLLHSYTLILPIRRQWGVPGLEMKALQKLLSPEQRLYLVLILSFNFNKSKGCGCCKGFVLLIQVGDGQLCDCWTWGMRVDACMNTHVELPRYNTAQLRQNESLLPRPQITAATLNFQGMIQTHASFTVWHKMPTHDYNTVCNTGPSEKRTSIFPSLSTHISVSTWYVTIFKHRGHEWLSL